MRNFLPIDRRAKCPICGHNGGWCCIGKRGDAVLCGRVPSNRPVGKKGAGWLHPINTSAPVVTVAAPKAVPTRTVARDWPRFAAQCVAALPDQCPLAQELGVSEASIGSLLLGWSVEHAAYTFPMRDGDGRIIGIRTRYRNGEKRAILGSQNGLFIPRGEPHGEIWICEGPTDCAALLTVGVYAVGRPSNTGGHDHLVRYCQRHRQCRDVVIVADRDAKPVTENATMTAARELAASLKKAGKRVKLIRPRRGIKDVREWINRGANAATLRAVIKDTMEFKP